MNDDEGTHLRAHAEGDAIIYQSARDIHLWFEGTVRRTLPTGSAHDCPYPGLAAFEEGQAGWFFGRDELIAELIARLDRRTRVGGVQVVIAPSGAGKSSLLRAGLLPSLGRAALPGSARWPTILCTPTAYPLHALAVHIGALTGTDSAVIVSELTGDLPKCAARLRQARVVVVIDQLEELFTLCADEQQRLLFVDALVGLSGRDAAGLVVVAVRADFYSACTGVAALRNALEDSPLVVGPMTTEQVRQAILDPARTVGLNVEPGLIEVLLRDLGLPNGTIASGGYEAGRLPLLAHALRATWQQRHGSTLTVDGYRNTGGIQNAIATSAEQVYRSLGESGRQQARSLLLRLVRVGDGTADVRRRLSRSELAEASSGTERHLTVQVVEAFAAARLLTLEQDSVEISHEALLYSWPRLRAWIDEDRSARLTHQALEETAAAWERGHQDTSLLYRGTQLKTARTWRSEAGPDELTRTGQAFLAASLRARRRGTRWRTVLTAVLMALTLAAGGAAWLANRQQHEAERQRDLVVYNQMLATADRLATTDISLSAQFALAAHRMNPGAETSTRLTNAAHAPLSTLLADHSDRVCAMAFHPNGRILATGSDDYRVQLWDVSNPAQPLPVGQQLIGHSGGVCALAFSPDGKTLATGAYDKTVRLWNITDPLRPTAWGKPLTGYKGRINAVAFSPDGTILATGGAPGSWIAPITDPGLWLWNVSDPDAPQLVGQALVGGIETVEALAFHPDGRSVAIGYDYLARVWNVANPAKPVPVTEPLTIHDDYVNAVAFSPDGKTLATGSRDQSMQLWGLADPRKPKAISTKITGHTGGVSTMAFSPDGKTLAVGCGDSTIRLWNVSDPTSPTRLGQPLAGHTGEVNALAYSADGHTLASSNLSGEVRLWNLPSRLLLGHTTVYRLANTVEAVAFSPDGRTLATGTSDNLVRLANVTDRQRPALLREVLSGHEFDVCTVAFSPDGRTLASGSFGGSVRLWDVAAPDHPITLGAPLTGHDDNACAVAFSPDGRTLATGSLDRSVQLWGVSDPSRPAALGRPITNFTAGVNSVAFSPDGRTLATGNGDATIRLWDITDPNRTVSRGGPLTGHTSTVYSIVFSPDGSTLASGSQDQTVRLWNVSNPDRPSSRGQPLTGHTSYITTVAYSPDGSTLASGSQDKTVRLWNVANPDQPGASGLPLIGHTGSVESVKFSPDGRALASGSTDQSVMLWDLGIERSVERICSTTAAILTAEQWHRYVGGVPYRPGCATE